MKLKIEKSWEQWFQTGYLYRVTSTTKPYMDQDGKITRDNQLFDDIKSDNWNNRSHLKTHIREWLESSFPYSRWHAEHPTQKGRIHNLGILFSRKSDIVLFKMAIG